MSSSIDKTDFSAGISLIVAAFGVIATLQFDETLGTIMTAVGVIVTAVLSYFKARRAEKRARESAREVADIAANASLETNAKTVFVQTVTAERATWRSELRDIATQLTAMLHASSRGEAVEWRDIDRLRSGIRLRLNPAGRAEAASTADRHEKDRRVHEVLDRLRECAAEGSALHSEIADNLE